ncbi:MAG: formate--tetrahydrofolate ligase [Spirochaetales bacterium]|nr:formate--tetrahydrofolate ligase [Spirochaetales bacterium]
MRSDIDIAQSCEPKHISEIAAAIGLSADQIIPYGHYMAKVPTSVVGKFGQNKQGKLILVTAMTPTPMGEGKTTTTIGLGQALSKIGKKTLIAIREPSLGPCMGVKGGAAGGGFSQVLPMEEINLHFTGDLHAITAANNLLAALLDNHLHQKREPYLNFRDIIFKRAIDMNDRSLRDIIAGCGGRGKNGVMREEGFEITAASEVMATLCLAKDLDDLKTRLGNIIVGYESVSKPVFARDLKAGGAMAALLKNAMLPNLVQTIEGTPVFVHGGPFANIAHGCNTLTATRTALGLADYIVTEAGFGADLGAEKFFNIKCRLGGLTPSAAVLVVTHRAWLLHGTENIAKHVENIRLFGVEPIISINKFVGDPEDGLETLKKECAALGVPAMITDFREQGSKGGLDFAEKVAALADKKPSFKLLYKDEDSLVDKITTIATKIYGAKEVIFTPDAKRSLKRITNIGFGAYPVCMAKTPASLSDNPKVPGRPKGFAVTVRDAKVSAGAGFVVVYTGDVMTMPGLPKDPAACHIDIDINGKISGLF